MMIIGSGPHRVARTLCPADRLRRHQAGRRRNKRTRH